MIEINNHTAIPEHETWWEFAHASGPGGQNVNKVATQATLCWCPVRSGALTPGQKQRILQRLRNRITKDGVLRITAGDQRTQAANRKTAIERFAAQIAEALRQRKKRIPTRPSRGANERRLHEKRVRADIKKRRGPVRWDE